MLSYPLGTNLHIWDPQIPALLKHFRVVRYDSRGHGASVANKGDYSVEGLGHDALAIMDALGVGKVHWLGLSMGGIIALWLLAHARERIGRAVLANTAAQIPGPDLWNSRIQTARDAGMDTVAMAAAERWFTKAFRDTHPEKVERVMEMVHDAAARLFGRLRRWTRHGSARSHSKHYKQGSASPGGTIYRHRQEWAPWSPVPSKAPNSSRWKPRICRISRMQRISPNWPSIS